MIPQGYKHTELGIIPQEWEVLSLSSLGKIYSGGTPDTTNPKFWNGEILWCTPSDVTSLSSNYISDTENKITEEGLKNSSATLLSTGSLIVCTRATIGNAAIAAGPLSTNQGFKNLVPGKGINSEWLLYNLQSAKSRLIRLGCGSTFLEVSKKDFERFKVAVPPVEEQRKIAEILGVWDKAIELQARLVDKLELRKRALMQRLLTGRLRLPGFSDPWQKVPINSFAKEISIKNKKNESLVVLSCTKYHGLVSSLEYFGKQIYSNDLRTYKIVPYKHFAYATNHIEEGSIGYQNIMDRALISPMYTVFCTDTKIVNDTFLFMLLKTHHLIYLYCSRMEGSIDRRGGLRWESFSSIKINLPSLAEQTAIAEVLSTADKEIEIAKARLAAYRTQKRGLMQQLLTGKKRVK